MNEIPEKIYIQMNEIPENIYKGSGKLSGCFAVLEEESRKLQSQWESGDQMLTEGQIESYKEARKEVESRLKEIILVVNKFEKLNELRKTL